MEFSSVGLFLSLAISTVGAGFFLFGRKQARMPQMVGGLVLIIYPYFVGNLWLMAGIAVAVIAGIGIAVRQGV
jgi:hypothetical protein